MRQIKLDLGLHCNSLRESDVSVGKVSTTFGNPTKVLQATKEGPIESPTGILEHQNDSLDASRDADSCGNYELPKHTE